jgi:hypothetical protein
LLIMQLQMFSREKRIHVMQLESERGTSALIF